MSVAGAEDFPQSIANVLRVALKDSDRSEMILESYQRAIEEIAVCGREALSETGAKWLSALESGAFSRADFNNALLDRVAPLLAARPWRGVYSALYRGFASPAEARAAGLRVASATGKASTLFAERPFDCDELATRGEFAYARAFLAQNCAESLCVGARLVEESAEPFFAALLAAAMLQGSEEPMATASLITDLLSIELFLVAAGKCAADEFGALNAYLCAMHALLVERRPAEQLLRAVDEHALGADAVWGLSKLLGALLPELLRSLSARGCATLLAEHFPDATAEAAAAETLRWLSAPLFRPSVAVLALTFALCARCFELRGVIFALFDGGRLALQSRAAPNRLALIGNIAPGFPALLALGPPNAQTARGAFLRVRFEDLPDAEEGEDFSEEEGALFSPEADTARASIAAIWTRWKKGCLERLSAVGRG